MHRSTAIQKSVLRTGFFRAIWVILLLVLLGTAACSSPGDDRAFLQFPAITSLPTATLTPEPGPPLPPPPVPTATPSPLRVFVAPEVPSTVRTALQHALTQPSFALVESSEGADVQVIVAPMGALAPEQVVATWVYALVAPFPTLIDQVTLVELQSAWRGIPSPTLGALCMDEETLAPLAAAWGSPAPGAVEVFAPQDLIQALWTLRPAWGIVPFEQLTPSLKVLTIDGHTPLHRHLDLTAYPLVLEIGVRGEPHQLARWSMTTDSPFTNRDESKMTLLAMTGVTALTRTTAWKMERNGVLYPAEKIHDWFTTADVVHISNEVSFWEECPPPQVTGMVFCSAPKYTELITYVQTSIIELTGNHLNDYGWEPFSYTLALYDRLGIPYYGGGRTITEAQRAVTLTHNGNLLGFVGCNPVGPPMDWVNGLKDQRPGSAPCDEAVLQAELDRLRAMGALPIATLQYWEFYEYPPTYQQRLDFRKLVDWGAIIVSGSQGHHPQGFDLYNGGFIHYGVGNLFFGDQIDPATRQTFVDRYLIYENRLLSVELLTAQIEDYSQPRPMTADERRLLLQKVFAASGW